MNKETLEALDSSIEKWEDIVSGRGSDKGAANCALCQIFIGKNCVDCPVAESVLTQECWETPYAEWSKHHEFKHRLFYPYEIRCARCRKLALKELEFLKEVKQEYTKGLI